MKSKKFAINKNFGIFFLFLLIIQNVHSSNQSRGWCWTHSMVNEPTFSLNPLNGGMNWGLCASRPKAGPAGQYTAIIETSNRELSETTSSIKAILFGDLGKTDEFVLGDGFERGSIRKINFTAKDIGKLHRIRLMLEGSQPYRCKKITIKKGAQTFTFECLKLLEPCVLNDGQECKMESEAQGTHPYEITMKAGSELGSGLKNPILVSILGKNGEGQFKMFSENGLKEGDAKSIRVLSNGIGEITGFKISLPERGTFKPIFFKVKDLITKQLKVWRISANLKNPGKDTFKMDSSIPINGKAGNDGGQDSNNPNGGLLSVKDKSQIISLRCDSKLENPSRTNLIFGPEYPTNIPNFMSVLARCPSNCHRLKDKVLGVGIHPFFTPICLAALVDNQISFYGGIISISILPGIPKYTIPPNFKRFMKGQNVMSFSGNVKKSFSVMKVDDVDIVEKDFRILDQNANLSHEGRLEMRVNGEWGTICSIGNNKLSAKRICKDIGYRDGEWKSPNTGKNYCKSFNGKNYCGAKLQAIHFSNIICTDMDTTFNKCNKELADSNKCSHESDAIINCFNENYNIDKQIPQNVVRLGSGKKSGNTYTGRLELMRDKEFLPVCDIGFNKFSANVACKQMGWEKGIIINKEGILSKFQISSDDVRGFSAENLACNGSEKSIEECKFNIKEINCKHDQDVVIQCIKGNGDPTGKSQYIKPVYNPAPILGKLKIPKFTVTCDDLGNKEVFRGDPGSLYLIVCPPGCARSPGNIWGTGIYTSNSNICRAAIHSGVIGGDKKETFIMSRTYGLKYYHDSDQNNIQSTQHVEKWPVSIYFSGVNSAYENMNKGMESSFLDIKNKINLFSPIQRLISSFVQTSSKNLLLPTPIFEWIQKDFTYSFNERNNILITEHKLTKLINFSIITRFTMRDFKGEDSFIFSYSGCNGLSLMVDKDDRLILGDVCNPAKRYATGYMVPLGDQILLYFKYSQGRSYLRIYSYGTKKLFERKDNLAFEFSESSAIGIGRMGLDKKNFFNGKIDFLQIYLTDVPIKLLNAVVDNIKIQPKSGVSPTDKTVDGRKCVSLCTNNPVPPNKGAGETPPEANPYKPTSSSNIKKGKTGQTDKVPGINGTFNREKANNIVSIQLNCQTNLLDKRFAGSVGKIFRVNCNNCMIEKAIVFGTFIYHPLSSVCKAANHAGAINHKGGDVIVEILPGAKAYNGSQGLDKSVSATFGPGDRSFRVTKAPKLIHIDCTTTALDGEFGKANLGKKFVVYCPQKCSYERKKIWGTDIYTDDSPICVAAIHYGTLSDKGGEISFMIEGSMSSYKKSKGFGIQSLSKGAHVRSFKFLGHKSAVSYKWSEDYTPKFKDKWSIITHSNAINSLSNFWSYKIDYNFIHEGKAQKLMAIKHSGIVNVKNTNEYGSWIILKNADFANGKIKFNILLVDDNPMAVLLRYVDKENYYAVEFGTSTISNVKLIERVDGNSKVIAAKSQKLLVDKWYRVVITLDFNNIKISLQSHKIRTHKIIFEKNLKSLSRGTLGFATKGNKKFYINGISIDEHKKNNDEKYENNRYSWNDLLRSINKKQRKIYCKELFNYLKDEIERCIEIHNFCQIKCDSYFPRKENILNFSCTRDCVKRANILESNTDKLSELLKNDIWVPKIKEKCDYRLPGENFYRMGIITEITQIGRKTRIRLKYMQDGNNYSKAEIFYPNKNLKRCGEELTARTDCMIK